MLHLFEGYGIEVEYMLVDADSFDVRPMADSLLALLNAGAVCGDVDLGPVSWSNELACHVIELKASQPTDNLRKLAHHFEQAVRDLREPLERCHLRLLPSAMHPWMDPRRDVVLWPHEYHEVYRTFSKIFDCRRHGWGNVQSVHLNLPFADDIEFRQLHAAVRLILPLLPALAASSPVVAGKNTGVADSRMQHYAAHCARIPCLSGALIPEPVYTRADYEQRIYRPIRQAIREFDTEEVMRAEFLNSRGAIARFDRGSIEIRVMDVQEYPVADVAICAAAIAIIKALVAEKWTGTDEQSTVSTESLVALLGKTTVAAEQAIIEDAHYLRQFGIADRRVTAAEFWEQLLRDARKSDSVLSDLFAPLEIIQRDGTLATRILRALGDDFGRGNLQDVYAQLADCLVRWEPFQP